MADVIGSRGPNRREYFIGCALIGVTRQSAPEAPTETLAKRAIEIGTEVHKQIEAAQQTAVPAKESA